MLIKVLSPICDLSAWGVRILNEAVESTTKNQIGNVIFSQIQSSLQILFNKVVTDYEMVANKPNIITIIEREGIELKCRGRDYWAPCPFHADKTPSFKVSVERQRWHCFGCGAHDDIIEFIIKLKGFSFQGALVYLGIRNGKPLPPDPDVERRRKIQRQYSEAITELYDALCEQSRELHNIRLQVEKNPTLTEAGAVFFAQKMGTLAEIEYKLDVLLEGSIEDHIELLKETKGNDSEKIKGRAA